MTADLAKKWIHLDHSMSEEQFKAFWEAIQSDSTLQQKLKGVSDSAAIVDIAKEAGFTISVEELQTSQDELSEDELLEGAAGGFDLSCLNVGGG